MASAAPQLCCTGGTPGRAPHSLLLSRHTEDVDAGTAQVGRVAVPAGLSVPTGVVVGGQGEGRRVLLHTPRARADELVPEGEGRLWDSLPNQRSRAACEGSPLWRRPRDSGPHCLLERWLREQHCHQTLALRAAAAVLELLELVAQAPVPQGQRQVLEQPRQSDA